MFSTIVARCRAMGSKPTPPIDEKLLKAVQRAQAPFGRVGRALGFRWVFPVGTMPIPYHPLIGLALLIGIPAAMLLEIAGTVAGFGGGDGGRWMIPFFAGLALGIPLSIPIVNWLMMVFAGPLLQGMLFGGSMIMLSAEIASGDSNPQLAVLPAAFVGLYLAQLIGGPIMVRRIQATNAAFMPVDPGVRPVVIEGDSIAGSYGRWLFDHINLGLVHVLANDRPRNPVSARRFARPNAADFKLVEAAIDRARPDGWSMNREKGEITAPGAEPPADAIRVRIASHRVPLWLVTGHRTLIEIEVDGRIRRLIGGEAKVISAVPLFTAFYWVALVGKSEWVLGFSRKKSAELAMARVYDLLQRAFARAMPQRMG